MVEVLCLGFLKMKLRNQLSEISNGSGIVVSLGKVSVTTNELKLVPGRSPNHSGAPVAETGPCQILFSTVGSRGGETSCCSISLAGVVFPNKSYGVELA